MVRFGEVKFIDG